MERLDELKEKAADLKARYGILIEVTDDFLGIKTGRFHATVLYQPLERGVGFFKMIDEQLRITTFEGTDEAMAYIRAIGIAEKHISDKGIKEGSGDVTYFERLAEARSKPQKPEVYLPRAALEATYEWLGKDAKKMDKFFGDTVVHTDIKGADFLKSIGL